VFGIGASGFPDHWPTIEERYHPNKLQETELQLYG
jgi:hypothetical protein